jgi:hypothetical protein
LILPQRFLYSSSAALRLPERHGTAYVGAPQGELQVMKLVLAAAMMTVLGSNAFAQPGPVNPQKQTPQQKLEPILPAQPPQVSTGTKPSPVGQPVTSTGTTPGYKPAPPPLKIKEPPPPPKK